MKLVNIDEAVTLLNEEASARYATEQYGTANGLRIAAQMLVNHAKEVATEPTKYVCCPKCGQWYSTIKSMQFNYCPNCGAKMVIKNELD